MRIQRLELHNFKCYADETLELGTGVTVIHGQNGSGKSSLLEASFFALYGTKALETTLDEVVTIGAEEMSVELSFTHAAETYHLTREVRLRDGSARTTTCVLEGPGWTAEGARDVRARVEELLRMDAEAFVNCAYVRQGEVNKLIEASPDERQDMLDDLLQLGRLETYRERASKARVGVGRVRDDTQGALSELEGQIAEKETENLHDRLDEARTELAAVESEIEKYERNREDARETLERAESALEEFESARERLSEAESEIETVRERIQETARERDRLDDRLEECRARLETIREQRSEQFEAVALEDADVDAESDLETQVLATEDRLESVREELESVTEELRETSVEKQEHDSQAANERERADELETEAAESREEATRLEAECEDVERTLSERRDRLAEMDEAETRHREAFEDAPVAFGEAEQYAEQLATDVAEHRERRAERDAELESARERLSEAEQLREAGNCPECGQPVEGSPHVEALDQRHDRVEKLRSDRERLSRRIDVLEAQLEQARTLVEHEADVAEVERERETIEQLLEERAETLTQQRERIEQLRAEADEHEREAEAARERAAEHDAAAADCTEEIERLDGRTEELSDRRDRLSELLETLEALDQQRAQRDRLEEKREECVSRNEERRDRLDGLRDRRDQLRERLEEADIERLEEQRDEAREYLNAVEPKLETLAEQRDDLRSRVGALENELETLEALRERRESLAATVERLDSLYDEAEDLQRMYAELRAQLRRQHVETLERMLNETFELVYQNDTYARLALDDEYRLSIYQKDDAQLDPGQLSGGERALFNLSLRCAIYRLLAEGIEGTAPMPPLILDEPTVFLDSEHVGQLLELIGAMYERGVDQILVVSHDENLVAAADELVRVRTDSTTNRSTVEQEREALLAADD